MQDGALPGPHLHPDGGHTKEHAAVWPAGCLRRLLWRKREVSGRSQPEAGRWGAWHPEGHILSPVLALTCHHPWDILSNENVFDLLATGPQECQGQDAPEKDQPSG